MSGIAIVCGEGFVMIWSDDEYVEPNSFIDTYMCRAVRPISFWGHKMITGFAKMKN